MNYRPDSAHNNIVEDEMKNSVLLGAMIGVVAATAIYNKMNVSPAKKAKKAIIDKLEDVLL